MEQNVSATQHSNSGKAKIIQIIPWEDKHKYFSFVKYPRDGAEYDLINARAVETKMSLKARIASAFLPFTALLFGNRIDEWWNYPMEEFFVFEQPCVWVKRPHNYKVGDIIDVTLAISKEVGQ